MVSGTEPSASFGLPPPSIYPRAPGSQPPSNNPLALPQSSLNGNLTLQKSINSCAEKAYDASPTGRVYRGSDKLDNHASDGQSDSVMHDQDTNSKYYVVDGMDVDSGDQNLPFPHPVNVNKANTDTVQTVSLVHQPSPPQIQFQIRSRVSFYQPSIVSFHLLKLQFKNLSGGQNRGAEDPEFQISQLRDALVVGDASVNPLREEVSLLVVSVSPLESKNQKT
jgi:hypothetical protein